MFGSSGAFRGIFPWESAQVTAPIDRLLREGQMFARLLLLFVLVPLVELALLIRIGNWLGFWPTIGIVVATGALGALLAKSQGARVLGEIRADLTSGRVPAARLLDGLLILAGGIVLLTPGLLTDALGLMLLLPVTRNRLKAVVRRRFEGMVQSGNVSMITLIR